MLVPGTQETEKEMTETAQPTKYSIRADVLDETAKDGYRTTYFLIDADNRFAAQHLAVDTLQKMHGDGNWMITGQAPVRRVTRKHVQRYIGRDIHVIKTDGQRGFGRVYGWGDEGLVLSVVDAKLSNGTVLSHTVLLTDEEIELAYTV